MPLAETLQTALAALSANRLRAALTILGVTIGVAAVIAMVTIGQGASDTIQSSLRGLGTNLVFVTPGSGQTGFLQASSGAATSLSMGDVAALEAPGAVPDAVAVEPELGGFVQVAAGDATGSERLLGTTPAYATIHDWQTSDGRFISTSDVAASAPVAVLGAQTASDLFADADPIGRPLTVKLARASGTISVRLRVIGVLEPKGQIAGFVNRDETIVVPITAAQKRIFGHDSVSTITLSAASPDTMQQVEDDARNLLGQRHRITPGSRQDFTVQSQQDLLATASLTTSIFTLLLGAIGGISLLVGGIGIMNIMLVSVTERTTEIGLRKALGARRRDIQTQFLLEAVALTTIGGAAGIALGLGLAVGAATLFARLGSPLSLSVSPSAIVLAVGISGAIGRLFGIYPARRAARLQPIVALRSE